MSQTLIFQPIVPEWALIALAGAAVVLLPLALWRGLAGWAIRALALGFVLVALTNPSLQEEARKALSDIVVLVVDDSASQGLSDRAFQTMVESISSGRNDALAAVSKLSDELNAQLSRYQ